MKLFEKLELVVERFLEIESKLSNPEMANKPTEFRKLSQEHAGLQELVSEYRNYKKLTQDLQSNRDLMQERDLEIAEMAREEFQKAEQELETSKTTLQLLLLPRDPNDTKNVMFEIRAGAGGDEAALFVGELFRLYQRYSEKKGWRIDILSMSPTGLGGFKEIISEIQGAGAFGRLKFEGGVHRVQRVPVTEAQGRIHTSTVTVAVLPEAEEVDVVLNAVDLRIDVFRSSGAGGQSVNTTDSAVRITHLPTNLVVVCQDERSQHKNKDKAMKILRSRLLEQERERSQKAQKDMRFSMVGTGDRSERIRTYNFPQGRLTDHRIGLTVYQLPEVMEGKIDEILDGLQAYYRMEALKAHGMV